jgi:hypothetical protein
LRANSAVAITDFSYETRFLRLRPGLDPVRAIDRGNFFAQTRRNPTTPCTSIDPATPQRFVWKCCD